MSDPSKSLSGMTRLRNYFLTGVVVCAPLAITAYLVWSLIGWVDSWVKPYIPSSYNPDNYLPFAVPGFGLLVALVLITLIGFLTANIIGRSIVSFGERLLNRMPLVRTLYSGLKQIFETVLANRADLFNKVALFEYPRKGAWSIVFIASHEDNEIHAALEPREGRTVAVFRPITPNVTTGYLLYVPEKDLIPLEMSVEDAAKLLISAGLVGPEYEATTRALADEALAKEGRQVFPRPSHPARRSRTASSRPKR
ncbi:membrane protein [Mesorhizobium sp. L-8-10]|uniref:DUF502 domain-containing protein n=1 Tax=unclassified Mesorhizobium TaxID=325217 RepID=UPI001927DF47|nr:MULTISPECIES: DUF502 domain-containing protein [unclassified Mesorhizobium]BCH25096.1 membrane protein [Mesorhizobium sp. L-8-3]BCH32852.1 membrane protein [Mesorhizobium sp. L-8-10]